MQKYNHIRALFFLGIFSMLLLHQVVPHLHHQHNPEHSHEDVGHTHQQEHHHDTPKKDNSKKGFLGFFLDFHVHSVVANEILITSERSVKQKTAKKEIGTPFSLDFYRVSTNYIDVIKIPVFQPPNTTFTPFLSSLTLRGPPILG